MYFIRTRVAVLPLGWHCVSATLGGVGDDWGIRCLHGSKSQDNGNGYLGLRVHFHVPNQKHREDAKRPVRGRTHGGMCICRGCDSVRVDARSSRCGRIPKSRDRAALKENEKEEKDPEDNAHGYCDPADLDVSSMNSDA